VTVPVAVPFAVEEAVTEPVAVPFAVDEDQMPQVCMPGPTYNQQLCDMAQGGGQPIPTDSPITLPELKEFDGARCPMNAWNKNILTPQQSTGSFCPQYECNSCCDDEALMTELGSKGTADTTLQYGPFQFHGCSSSGKAETGGAMGSKCHDFVKTARCVQSCDPNAYVFYPDGTTQGATDIPTCNNFCQDFYAACANEYMCYNAKEITELLVNYDPAKTDYKIFQCEGEYTCEQLKDTPFAGNGMLYELNPDLKEKIRELIDEKFGGSRRKPHQIFCERFSSKLFNPVVSESDQCYDPRNPADIHQAVIDQQQAYNNDPEKTKTNFPKTEVCSTGLSGGAIAGIVIGCLAGVALIGVAIYFLACRGGEDGEDNKGQYDVAKQNEDHHVEMSEPKGDIVKTVSIKSEKSNHDYDPNESQRE